jgi:hypothetical protein
MRAFIEFLRGDDDFGGFSWWWQLIGACSSGLSLVSLAQKLFTIGLAPFFAGFLDFYRSLFYPLINAIFFLVPFRLADWYKDLFCISFFLAAAYWKSAQQIRYGFEDTPFLKAAGVVALSLVVSVPLLALAAPLLMFGSMPEESEEFRRLLAIAAIVVVVFFLLNATVR